MILTVSSEVSWSFLVDSGKLIHSFRGAFPKVSGKFQISGSFSRIPWELPRRLLEASSEVPGSFPGFLGTSPKVPGRFPYGSGELSRRFLRASPEFLEFLS